MLNFLASSPVLFCNLVHVHAMTGVLWRDLVVLWIYAQVDANCVKSEGSVPGCAE